MLASDQNIAVNEKPGGAHVPSWLLSERDPSPVKLLNEFGDGPFVIGCEHAGNRIPESMKPFGLRDAQLSRHIAWDIGAAALTEYLSVSLNSPAILQRYSRLVYDCNRTRDHDGAFVIDADGTYVKANDNLSESQKLDREFTFYRPFHNALDELIDRRCWKQDNFSYVAIHSFNSEVRGETRPWHIGMIYNQHSAMSKYLVRWFEDNTEYVVGDNEPYSPKHAVDHTIRVQAEVKDLPYTMIEVRNDLLQDEAQIAHWGDLLTRSLQSYVHHSL